MLAKISCSNGPGERESMRKYEKVRENIIMNDENVCKNIQKVPWRMKLLIFIPF